MTRTGRVLGERKVKMKIRKIMCVILAAMALSCSFASCGDKGGDKDDDKGAVTADAGNADVKATADKIKSDVTFEDQLIEADGAKIEKIFGINSGAYTNAKVYISSSGATPEEIACFEATSPDMAGTIKTALEARIKAQTATFTDYKPEQAPKLQNPVLKVNGSCVYYVVSGDSAKAESIIG